MTFVRPSDVVEKLDIRPGMKVGDFGCGSGHYSIEFARRVGKDGKVLAFDIRKEVLEAVESRALAEGLADIEIRRADLETEKGTQLAEGILDFVLISSLLFQVEDKPSVAKEAFRVLRKGGRVGVVDWEPSEHSLGPKKEQSMSKETAREIFQKTGFVFEREFDAGKFHYGLMFIKQQK